MSKTSIIGINYKKKPMERIIGKNKKKVRKSLCKEESQPSLTKWS